MSKKSRDHDDDMIEPPVGPTMTDDGADPLSAPPAEEPLTGALLAVDDELRALEQQVVHGGSIGLPDIRQLRARVRGA